jgi:cell division protein FtsX
MLLTLALRNIWRNKRRSLLTISAMVVSSSLLILALGVFSGMLRDMLASATEQYHGHIVVARQGYQHCRG